MATKLISTNDTKFVFLGTRNYTKQGNTNTITFVKLGDVAACENFEFMADQQANLNFATGDVVIPIFEMSNYQNRPSLRLQTLTQAK